jgi:hypothetical protein
MTPSVEYGTPLFTEGVFGRTSAQDDLGIEEVGAGLLRRLIPGVIQNTPNAGYYSFYPYLLWKWEQLGGSTDRNAFAPFFRRHESAYALACVLHDHRDDGKLSGINGAEVSRRRARELEAGAPHLDLAAHAEQYMETELGGYGLFYVAALQEARLVRGGARGLVDRVTEQGEFVARAFAEVFEQTSYAKQHLESSGMVTIEELRELGDLACLCTIPGRADQEPLLQTFFEATDGSPAWEDRRRTRVESLSLLLEFHEQRPPGDEDDLFAWRRALVDPRFSGGASWSTAHPERRESWRAYQLRELSVLALTTIWSIYLARLGGRVRATHRELAEQLLSQLTEEELGFPPTLSLREASGAVGEAIPDAYALGLEAEPLWEEWREEPARALCRALRLLIRIPREMAGAAAGFTELLDEGGDHRWSLRYLDEWLAARAEFSVAAVASDLLDALHHQHVRVALTKVRVPTADNLQRVTGNWRDPFNFTEDDGILRLLRPDEPFWSGARYAVGNHFLWTLGLLTSPEPPIEVTPHGREILKEHAGDA